MLVAWVRYLCPVLVELGIIFLQEGEQSMGLGMLLPHVQIMSNSLPRNAGFIGRLRM